MAIPIIFQSIESIFIFYVCSFAIASIASFMTIRAMTTHTVIHHKLILLYSLGLIIAVNIIAGIMLAGRLSRVPQFMGSTPSNKQILPIDSPSITLEFSDPVLFPSLQIHTFPENDLDIEPSGYFFSMLPIGRKIRITPKQSYQAGSPIMLYVSNIEGPLTHGYGGEILVELESEHPPKIVSVIRPSLFTDVSTTDDIQILLDKPSWKYSQWNVTSVPEKQFDIRHVGNEMTLHPTTPLLQGTTYSLSISQVSHSIDYESENISQTFAPISERILSFATIKPPFVQRITPSRQTIYPSEDILIDFIQPMNTQKTQTYLSLFPEIPYSATWERSNTRLRITHDTFAKNSSVSAVLSKGFQTEIGGTLESDIRFDFNTPGVLDIATSFPKHTQTDAKRDMPIRIEFNQPINANTVTKAVSVEPQFSFTTTASESSIQLIPVQKLKPDTHYTIRLATSLTGTYGLPPSAPLSVSFTTESESVLLPVPFYKQESSFTCNIAAVRMLLAYKNIAISEKDLISGIGLGGKRGTGNPNIGYIDDYGTYWNAISKGISNYSKYTIIQNGTIKDIIASINAGKPIMIWGQNGWSDPHDISWTSTDGAFIKAVNGMHSSVVRGYKGSPENPTEIYLNDPWRGQYAIPTKEFLRRWGYFSVAMSLD